MPDHHCVIVQPRVRRSPTPKGHRSPRVSETQLQTALVDLWSAAACRRPLAMRGKVRSPMPKAMSLPLGRKERASSLPLSTCSPGGRGSPDWGLARRSRLARKTITGSWSASPCTLRSLGGAANPDSEEKEIRVGSVLGIELEMISSERLPQATRKRGSS